MEYERLNQYLLTKPGSKKEFPFGNEPAVFKVGGKMFALLLQKQDHVSFFVLKGTILPLNLRVLSTETGKFDYAILRH